MPKKKAVKLPQVSGASPRRSLQLPGAAGLRGLGAASDELDADDALPRASLSEAEAQLLSDSIDASIPLPPGFGAGRPVAGPDESGAGAESWEPQGPEEILSEVRKVVMERSPWHWEEDFDDSVLERRRRSERELRGDGGIHIILPDNRVRAVEDQIGGRVRAELLGDETMELAAPPMPRRPDEGRPRGPRRHRNPWYLPAKNWYNPEALKDPNAERGGGFPYDSQILRAGEAEAGKAEEEERDAGSGGDGPARALTRREKESLQIVDAYKQYMKGHRLPHFLQ